MRLLRLRLDDLRRFPVLELELAPGLNLVQGGNGAGKSTVLEAIGFALFGAPLGRAGGSDLDARREGAGELRAAFTGLLGLDRYPRAALAAAAAAAPFRAELARIAEETRGAEADLGVLDRTAAELATCAREADDAVDRRRRAERRLADLDS